MMAWPRDIGYGVWCVLICEKGRSSYLRSSGIGHWSLGKPNLEKADDDDANGKTRPRPGVASLISRASDFRGQDTAGHTIFAVTNDQ